MDLGVNIWRAALVIVVSGILILLLGVGPWLVIVLVMTTLAAINKAAKHRGATRR